MKRLLYFGARALGLATMDLLLCCLPSAWALQFLMRIATIRAALGPDRHWPAESVRSAIPDLKVAWRRRMFVWAQEHWQMAIGRRLGSAEVCRHLSVVGLEHVREAVQSGNGAIVIFVHQVGMNAIGWILMEAGLPWSQVTSTRFARRNWLEQWRPRYWMRSQAFGAERILHWDTAGVKQAYRRLGKGEVVCLAQDVVGERYRVKLLGRNASLALGSVRLAMATGARLIPCAVVTGENNTLEVCFRPPIKRAGGEGELVEAVTRAVEELILSGPELWFAGFVHSKTEMTYGRAAVPQPLKDATERFVLNRSARK